MQKENYVLQIGFVLRAVFNHLIRQAADNSTSAFTLGLHWEYRWSKFENLGSSRVFFEHTSCPGHAYMHGFLNNPDLLNALISQRNILSSFSSRAFNTSLFASTTVFYLRW